MFLLVPSAILADGVIFLSSHSLSEDDKECGCISITCKDISWHGLRNSVFIFSFFHIPSSWVLQLWLCLLESHCRWLTLIQPALLLQLVQSCFLVEGYCLLLKCIGCDRTIKCVKCCDGGWRDSFLSSFAASGVRGGTGGAILAFLHCNFAFWSLLMMLPNNSQKQNRYDKLNCL